MSWPPFGLLTLVATFLVGWYAGSANPAMVYAHRGHQYAPEFTVPQSWVTLKAVGGGDGRYFYFEDGSGTIRITTSESRETPFALRCSGDVQVRRWAHRPVRVVRRESHEVTPTSSSGSRASA